MRTNGAHREMRSKKKNKKKSTKTTRNGSLE